MNNVTEPGVYNGFFFLEDDDISSIPITIDIRPPLEKIIILIIDGIAVSIIFWKILKFINLRYQIVIDPQTLAQSAKTVSFSDYITNSKITKGSVIKNALLDLGSVIFGIVIGLVPILNDDFVNNIRIISPFVVLVLFVIGLGLGSIKELIYSKSEPQES